MPSDIREKIVEEARTWLETPYLHLGRRKGIECDCIGIISKTGQSLELLKAHNDESGYSDNPHGGVAESLLDKHLIRYHDVKENGPIELERILPGDMGLFWYKARGVGQHCCIFARHRFDPKIVTMIHSLRAVGKVTEATVNPFWKKRLLRLYRFPGVS